MINLSLEMIVNFIIHQSKVLFYQSFQIHKDISIHTPNNSHIKS
jgi:hypothetical protein